MPPFSREGLRALAIVNGLTPKVFQVVSVELSAGGRQLDHAVVEVDLAAAARYVENLDLAKLNFPTPQGNVALSGAEMTILLVGNNGLQRPLHWGKTSVYELNIPDKLTLVSRLEQTHFGS